MKDFMNKPITWGGYLKLCGICTGISTVWSLGYVYYMYKKYWS